MMSAAQSAQSLASWRTLVRGLLCAVLGLSLPEASQAQTGRTDQSEADGHPDGDLAQAPSMWKAVIGDSVRLLVIEQSTRIIFQQKTRRELGGPFFADYRRSVRTPTTWNDGDSWGVNYVGHPIHGAAAGFIWLDHEDGSHDPDPGFSAEYWASRCRALAWAAVYSLQFEFGPISEASIGNVGMRPNTTGWVDHVVTPVGAFGFIVAEDVLDRYVIVRIERWTGNRAVRATARILLNPSRTLSNSAQRRLPWWRAVRPLRRSALAASPNESWTRTCASSAPDRSRLATAKRCNQ